MPLEWIFIEIFVIIVEVSALFYLLCSKFTARYRTFIPTLLFILINIIIISLPKFISFSNLLIAEILVPLICLLYLLFFKNGSMLKKIFWTLLSFAIIVSIAFFSITIISFASGVNSVNIVTQSSSERLMAVMISKTLQVFIFYVLAKIKRNNEIKSFLSPMPMLACFTVPFISSIIIIFMYSLIHDGLTIPENVIIAVSVGYLAINIVVFVLYELINREAEKNYVLIAKNKQHELTEQHNEQVIEIYEKIREWKHDYNNHMQLVVGMLEKADSNDNSEAIEYIKNLDEKIKSASLEIVTGNYIVDAIVSAKATLASAHHITFEHNIYLPGDIAMESTDLCSILSNLLDNAIEACCKLEQDRYINFEVIQIKNQLNVKISNSTNGVYKIENGRFKTTKRGDLHGIGMGHIRSIVENYGGFFDVDAEVHSFTAQITIPLVNK